MKIFSKVILIGSLAIFFAQYAFAGDYTVRKTNWGMSIEQVKSSESLPLREETEKSLFYRTNILNKNMTLVYGFVDNKLTSVSYLSAVSHSNKTDFITDYEEFKTVLTKKYGKTIQDRTIWKNDLYKSDYSHWGMAISIGHLIYLTKWETTNTTIANMLTGDNYKITHVILYNSKKLKGLGEKAKEKEALDAL